MRKRGPKPKRKEIHWSPELAYAVGLIASDGCLSNDGRHLDFTSKELEQVHTFANCMKLPHIKVGKKNIGKTNEAYRVQWGDVVFYNFLLSIGLTPHKSRTIGALAIPDEFFFDFLRGSFDGDGSFYSYYDPRWSSSFMYYMNFTSASPPHVLWLQKTVQRLLGVRGHMSKVRRSEKRNEIWTLRYAKAESLKVADALYTRRHAPHLPRKRLKIERALRIVGESLPKARKRDW